MCGKELKSLFPARLSGPSDGVLHRPRGRYCTSKVPHMKAWCSATTIQAHVHCTATCCIALLSALDPGQSSRAQVCKVFVAPRADDLTTQSLGLHRRESLRGAASFHLHTPPPPPCETAADRAPCRLACVSQLRSTFGSIAWGMTSVDMCGGGGLLYTVPRLCTFTKLPDEILAHSARRRLHRSRPDRLCLLLLSARLGCS